MKTATYKTVEFILIFLVIPISFAFTYPFVVKASLGVIGFLYVLYILLKVEATQLKIKRSFDWKFYCKQLCFRLSFIALLTILFMCLTNRGSLFSVLLEKPKTWVIMLFVYSLFSVVPQEIIFRTLYFKRYKCLVRNQNLFILLNAVVFSLAHLFYKNTLVLLITFLGGLLFALTFKKTKSTILVSIEHAIYGCWLFTVGMGEMLGFPS